MKYSNHLSLIVLLALTIFTSCNPDENDEKNSDVLSDIKDLAEDSIFSSYLNLIITDQSISATELNAATTIMKENANLAALNNTQKLDLANHLGFIDYDDMIEYTNSVGEIRKQLEEMYKLSSYDWKILQPIYKKEISEMIFSNRSKSKKTDPRFDRCLDEDLDQEDISTDQSSWKCYESFLDSLLEALEDSRIIAETDPDCEPEAFEPYVYPLEHCSSTSESYLSWRRMFLQKELEWQCCVIESCETEYFTVEEIDEKCALLIG